MVVLKDYYVGTTTRNSDGSYVHKVLINMKEIDLTEISRENPIRSALEEAFSFHSSRLDKDPKIPSLETRIPYVVSED
jgi:hypothetical protein